MSGSIVCGVDGSESATCVARFARTLSERLGLRLVVVTVTNVPVVSPRASPGGYAELRALALDVAGELLDTICKSEGLSEQVVRRVELGNPAERLTAVSDEEAAELLVVGSRGRGRLASAILGSVSAQVVRRARCPVTVLRVCAASAGGAGHEAGTAPRRARSSALHAQPGGHA